MHKKANQISPAVQVDQAASKQDLADEIDLLLMEARSMALALSGRGFNEWPNSTRAAYSGAMVRTIDTLKALIQRQHELETIAE